MHWTPAVERYASFADHQESGNPAGVVLDAQNATADEMQHVAADIGYSETVFVTSPITADAPITVRYFAPEGEVAFCGHATIALTAALGRELGFRDVVLETGVGPVIISAERRDGRIIGSFRSRPVSSAPIDDATLDDLLALLGWTRSDLHPGYSPAIGFSGNRHPVLVARDVARLADLDYDFDGLRHLSRAEGWVTIQLISPSGAREWRSRNPFPWGGVVEDPATGSAAAAFAGYLRESGYAETGDRFTIVQGVEMGRPSRIEVELLDDAARIAGAVTPIDVGAGTTRAGTDHGSGKGSTAR